MQINCVLKDELQKTVGDNMKRDGKFYGNCRDMRGQHAHQHNGNDGNVVEAGKNSNYLPEPFGCVL